MSDLNYKSIRKKLGKRVYLDLKGDYTNSVLLSGSGRSGTTWIANIINYDNRYRLMFEPFHPQQVGVWNDINHKLYFSPNDKDEEYIAVVRKILSGKIKERWVDRFNERCFCQKRLIKCIFANLLLKGIHENFPGIPIVLLFRHPCAVVASQIGRVGRFGDNHEDYFTDKLLAQEILHPFKGEFQKLKTDFERYTFIWCIQYYVPLKQFKNQEIHLAFYEEFCENPRCEIERLFNFLGEKYDEQIFNALGEPSQTCWDKDHAILTGERLIDSWRKQITPEQTKRMVEILKIFGLDGIYSEDSMPNSNAAYQLLGKE